jgi:hypothetical protein
MSVTLGGGPIQADPEVAKDVEMGGSEPVSTISQPQDKVKGSSDGNQIVEELEVNGDIPQARFGHTITIVSKAKVVLFGGATGDTGKYSMTGETYMYNILNKAWQKLTGKSTKV